MHEAERLLHDVGCPKINLQVRATNSEVIEFYEGCGFSVEDRASLGKPLTRDPSAITDPVPTISINGPDSLKALLPRERSGRPEAGPLARPRR